ncbi:hypothetical protein B0H11DRAFT_1941977 [Mycena galericulata]|nr:hypothetical protein B0H11DRAFT_1941977 [Mycena galericulata]
MIRVTVVLDEFSVGTAVERHQMQGERIVGGLVEIPEQLGVNQGKGSAECTLGSGERGPDVVDIDSLWRRWRILSKLFLQSRRVNITEQEGTHFPGPGTTPIHHQELVHPWQGQETHGPEPNSESTARSIGFQIVSLCCLPAPPPRILSLSLRLHTRTSLSAHRRPVVHTSRMDAEYAVSAARPLPPPRSFRLRSYCSTSACDSFQPVLVHAHKPRRRITPPYARDDLRFQQMRSRADSKSRAHIHSTPLISTRTHATQLIPSYTCLPSSTPKWGVHEPHRSDDEAIVAPSIHMREVRTTFGVWGGSIGEVGAFCASFCLQICPLRLLGTHSLAGLVVGTLTAPAALRLLCSRAL